MVTGCLSSNLRILYCEAFLEQEMDQTCTRMASCASQKFCESVHFV